MKQLKILALSFLILGAMSCSKDNAQDSGPDQSRLLIGEWEAITFIMGSTDFNTIYDGVYLEFESNGTFEFIADSWILGRNVGLGTWYVGDGLLNMQFNRDAFSFCDDSRHTFDFSITGSSFDEELNIHGECERMSLKAEFIRL